MYYYNDDANNYAYDYYGYYEPRDLQINATAALRRAAGHVVGGAAGLGGGVVGALGSIPRYIYKGYQYGRQLNQRYPGGMSAIPFTTAAGAYAGLRYIPKEAIAGAQSGWQWGHSLF